MKKAFVSLAAVAALAASTGGASVAGAAPGPDQDHKVSVCKLVGKPAPGDTERVKGGKQPIVVDEHALNGNHFSDAQQSPQFPGPCAVTPPPAPPAPPGPAAAPSAAVPVTAAARFTG